MTEERQKWLGITYTAPAKPSKARVYIWRKLKELGAEYYHGMAMIPQSPKTLDSVKKLAARMRELGAEEAFLRIRAQVDPTACFHQLTALAGAELGVPKKAVPEEKKAELRAFFDSL